MCGHIHTNIHTSLKFNVENLLMKGKHTYIHTSLIHTSLNVENVLMKAIWVGTHAHTHTQYPLYSWYSEWINRRVCLKLWK